jgi:CheY-like chemotaxis protein
MGTRYRVLLVGSSGIVQALAPILTAAGYELSAVADFARARTLLDTHPDLLITELKLGMYNGLHLAIRARTAHTPTIVIGEADPVLEAEAERQEAKYLTPPVDARRLAALVNELIRGASHMRRSIRKKVPPVEAVVNNEARGHLRDVSYDGMQLEAAEHDGPPSYFDLRLPQFDFSCRVQRIWMSPADDDRTRIWCGVALADSDNKVASEWRALVDAMPGFAVH